MNNKNTPVYCVDQMPLMLGSRQVAQLLNVSQATARSLMKKGELPCKKVGKRTFVPRDRLLEWAGIERVS